MFITQFRPVDQKTKVLTFANISKGAVGLTGGVRWFKWMMWNEVGEDFLVKNVFQIQAACQVSQLVSGNTGKLSVQLQNLALFRFW